jgi:hypothetical protein
MSNVSTVRLELNFYTVYQFEGLGPCGCAVAQAVYWPVVHRRGYVEVYYDGQSGTGKRFLQVLMFTVVSIIPPLLDTCIQILHV